MKPIARPPAPLARIGAGLAALALVAACGSSTSTTARSSTASTSSTASDVQPLEPGPITIPECAGGNASARVALASGRLRQVDVTDSYVCLEGDGRMLIMMPMPSLPHADTPTFVIDVRDSDGGLFVFALPDGFPRPGAVRTADRHPVAYVTSPNGRALAIFDPQALQGPAAARFELLAADGTVAADLTAVYPRQAVDGGPLPTLPADDAAVPGAIAASLLRDPGPRYLGVIVTDTEAACIGDGVVSALGLLRVRDLGIGAAAWPALATGMGLTPDEADRVVDVLRSCAEHWKRFAFLYATEGTGEMSERSAQCVERELTDDEARTFFVKERSGYRTMDHIRPVEDAIDRCLTATERRRIDWN